MVAHQRKATAGELDSNLVAAASVEAYMDKAGFAGGKRGRNGGGKEQTQKEVADQLGISQSYISRLEKRIIQRLKKEILRLS